MEEFGIARPDSRLAQHGHARDSASDAGRDRLGHTDVRARIHSASQPDDPTTCQGRANSKGTNAMPGEIGSGSDVTQGAHQRN
jgi:hypothetical protein